MTGYDLMAAGVWGTPMPMAWHCMRLHRVDESMRVSGRISQHIRLQRDWCARWYVLSVGYQSARHGHSHGQAGYALPGADTNAYMCSALWGAGGVDELLTPQAHRMSESLLNEVPKKRPPFLASLSRPQGLANEAQEHATTHRRPRAFIVPPALSYGDARPTSTNQE
jgi:hypothetical protein